MANNKGVGEKTYKIRSLTEATEKKLDVQSLSRHESVSSVQI